jgi:hypothetical protein
MNRIIFIASVLIVGLYSCTSIEEPNDFINVDKLNTEISNKTDVDILKFKKRIDKKNSSNDKFYKEALDEMISSGNCNSIYKDFGFVKKVDGSDFTIKESKKVLNTMYKLYQNNIVKGHCDDNKQFCIDKKIMRDDLSNVIEVNGSFDSESMNNQIFLLNEKEYLNKNEFEFLVLMSYTMLCVQAPVNKKAVKNNAILNQN